MRRLLKRRYIQPNPRPPRQYTGHGPRWPLPPPLSGRWIVERTIGWLDNFRRLTVRYGRLQATYGGFFHLA